MSPGLVLAPFLLSLAQGSSGGHAGQPPLVLGGTGHDNGFTTLSPDPSLLVWDAEPSQHPDFLQGKFRAGWLKVPVLHDPYITSFESSPEACLRVFMKPAAKQPAKLGPILLHCGGPGSDASCAADWGFWLELNSTYLVGPPLSDDYDYWSVSQRGMDQDALTYFGFQSACPFKDAQSNPLPAWPHLECNGIDELVAKSGLAEVLSRLDGSPDPGMWPMLQEIREGPTAQTFGVPFFNETYVRWLYREVALEQNLCFKSQKFQMHSPSTNRSYNTLEHSSTVALGYDIELVRQAIGAQKMSVYGVSYGTKVGSVYATLFPDKVHRLILDGDMGLDPDVENFAHWVGESTEAVWDGLAMACDNSAMAAGPNEPHCPAGPGVTAKMQKLFKDASTPPELSNAMGLFNSLSQVVYTPGVPGAAHLMKCIASLHAASPTAAQICGFSPQYHQNYPGVDGSLAVISQVLGMDVAGRLTEESFVRWWRTEKELQPLGITRSLQTTVAVGTWPAIPRPDPPTGDAVVAPLVIGNLFDGQTPYKMAQRMIEAFPSGRLLTTQFYGHGLQRPDNVSGVVARYEDEMRRGVLPTYDDETAKLLCVKVALEYLKDGTLPRDYVCKAAGPAKTVPEAVGDGASQEVILV